MTAKMAAKTLKYVNLSTQVSFKDK